MKELFEKVMLFVVCGVAIFGCCKALQLQDQHEKERAIARCGSESNLVEHYTQQGDVYYSCKVEK